MLGKEKENDRVKVDRYWPEEGEAPLHFHNIQVTLKEKLYDADLSIAVRKLELTYTLHESDKPRQSRVVMHYQYEGWPDHGVPDSANPIRQLVRIIEQERFKPLSFPTLFLPPSVPSFLFSRFLFYSVA
jgi:protein tyrosine phosphatase